MYTVKQLSDMAGVTIRTLHHYDAIGLLKPAHTGSNGYRYYGDDAVMRLQQILFYRELGLELADIRAVLDDASFDYIAALETHREGLKQRVARLQEIIETVGKTIRHFKGEITMSKHEVFKGLNEEEERDMTREARLTYGPSLVNDSVRRWGSYSQAQKDAILAEGNTIYAELASALEAGTPAQDAEVQRVLVRWHNHIHYFYEPTLDVLRGLGELYRTDARFIANFQKLHIDLPDFLHEGIEQYVDDLETAELERMLADDEARRSEK
ncbi:MAG: MerR family transcriptional regulator [Chloroflexota bacterium]|nr:MerR family transcriptional regulator [Chloroflexota bacterium]